MNNLTLNPQVYTDANGNRALSPHKISRNNKMRRYEESNGQNISYNEGIKDLE